MLHMWSMKGKERGNRRENMTNRKGVSKRKKVWI